MSDLTAPARDSGGFFGIDAIAGRAGDGRRLRFWMRLLPLIDAAAIAAIILVVGYRFVLREDSLAEASGWAAALVGLALLGYVTQRVLGRNLVANSRRQASLLQAVSDIGEGLLIFEKGRYIAANAAYHALTGYSPAEITRMGRLIELVPADERARLTEALAPRLKAPVEPFSYESTLRPSLAISADS